MRLLAYGMTLAAVLLASGCSSRTSSEDSLWPLVELKSFRSVPGCGAMGCEEERQIVLAIDAVLAANESCQSLPPLLLREMYRFPMQRLEDSATVPAVGRVDNFGRPPFQRYWAGIGIADQLTAVNQVDSRCMLILAPPRARSRGDLVVEMVILSHSESEGRQYAQWFVTLRQVNGDWRATGVTYGRVS